MKKTFDSELECGGENLATLPFVEKVTGKSFEKRKSKTRRCAGASAEEW